MIRVTVWNEYFHEQVNEQVRGIYPNGMHNTIADFLRCDDIEVRTATLYAPGTDFNCENPQIAPDAGLTEEVLKNTDVLIWWGHCRHAFVPDEIAMRVKTEVLKGMGFIGLHSAHGSKPFRLLMGSTGYLTWRINDDVERVWTVMPSHPIAQGVGRYFELHGEETYGEPFGIPNPDDLVFIGWYNGGEVFRSGCTFHRDNGRIFYFQPGHETYPTFHNENVQTVIRNAVRWAAPVLRVEQLTCPQVERIEPMPEK